MAEGSGYEAQHLVLLKSCTDFILNDLRVESLKLSEEEKQQLIDLRTPR